MKIFGQNPRGKRLQIIQAANNFRNGSFANIEETVLMRKGVSTIKVLKSFINKQKTTEPTGIVPHVRTDLKKLDADKPQIVWFGHSSYLICSAGFNILVDPVFSGNASPFPLFAKAFKGSNCYGVEDMPDVDLLVLTHDHYDHLDYTTITRLDKKVTRIVTSLGVGQHLEYWGINAAKITELNWWEKTIVNNQIQLTATPARHFSGRGIKRGATLWSSFILDLHGKRIFIGGDSGYDSSFVTIGEKYGPFDLAILENGQYNENWPDIHMMPEEVVLAAKDLNAASLLPVHWGKFSLSLHAWNEPAQRVVKAATSAGQTIIMPRIGEVVTLSQKREWPEWWNTIG